ncbi:hypothetical protein EV702DRAFT_1204869 [Suillus placidus]|uniref:Uncharacterized protein n=1 Tax=Suillus placidus TaxID=48579 RepID=A0A9P6ZG63_9AGAM|nr:hypothetical protein EV702DRAFT_1204869 [Suillus placidus]
MPQPFLSLLFTSSQGFQRVLIHGLLQTPMPSSVYLTQRVQLPAGGGPRFSAAQSALVQELRTHSIPSTPAASASPTSSPSFSGPSVGSNISNAPRYHNRDRSASPRRSSAEDIGVMSHGQFLLISLEKCDYTLVHFLVALPFEIFTPSAVAVGIENVDGDSIRNMTSLSSPAPHQSASKDVPLQSRSFCPPSVFT